MNESLKVTRKFHVARRHHGRKQLHSGAATDVPAGRVPRVARVMALAIRCDQLIRDGVIANQSELAEFGQITTARMTQIMTLLNLAPDIQEQILFLSRTQRGRDPIIENWERERTTELERQPSPLILGEFGLDPNWDRAADFAHDLLTMADRMLVGWSYWSYDPGGWGLHNADGSDTGGTEWMVRIYPRAIAGVPTEIVYDAAERRFRLTFVDREGTTGATEIAVPEHRLFAERWQVGWTVALSDAEAEARWDAMRRVLSVTTPVTGGSHTIEIVPVEPD